MNQWNLIIDVARCENCNNCLLASKDEFVDNDFPGYSAPHALHGSATIKIERKVRGAAHMVDAAYLPVMCNHCDDAPCIRQADGVISKRADGIVIIDPVKSRGRDDLVAACPYGAIVWNAQREVPQQWIFDAHLLDQGWTEPRCAHSCPTGAIRALKVDAADMAGRVRAENLKVLKPELGTRPRVYYRNLYRFTDCFIGASVVVRLNNQENEHANEQENEHADEPLNEQPGEQLDGRPDGQLSGHLSGQLSRKLSGQLECAEGVTVELLKNDEVVQRTVTDTFGDFRFDGLAAHSGAWQVRIAFAQYKSLVVDAVLGEESLVLGNILLERIDGEG